MKNCKCNCDQERYFVGTDLKFAIDITADGFSMDSDDYSMVLVCGNKQVTVTKADIKEDDGGVHYLMIDTNQFPAGMLRLVVTARVPDTDFTGGIRREVDMLDLCLIKKAI